MAAPDGFKLAEELRQTFLSYLTSALPIGNHHSQRELGRQFYQQWSSELFAGPFVEALPAYERVGSLDDYFGDVRDRAQNDYRFAAHMDTGVTWADVEHHYPQYRRIRDAIWPPNSDEAGIEEELGNSAARLWKRPLYAHQWQSFEAVVRKHRNLIVATATGSGKTECYLIPLLYHLLTEAPETRRSAGVRAVLLYPMNALVEDQMHRLRQLLFWINLESQHSSKGKLERPITFGRYTGATPVNAADRDPQRQVSPEALQGLGELVYRDEMQSRPPDILVTNFTMLEYILLRDDDQRLFLRPDLFQFLILDEVHTYTGTQGMEVSLLLRRLKAFLNMKCGAAARFQAVGTSATLPSGSDAKVRTATFASTLFDLPFNETDVIRPDVLPEAAPQELSVSDRTTLANVLADFDVHFPNLAKQFEAEETEVPEQEWAALARCLNPGYEGPSGSPEAQRYVWHRLADILDGSKIVQLLRHVLTRRELACLDLGVLASELFPYVGTNKQATTVLLKIVGAAYREDAPILSLRFHMFVNEPASAQVCLLPRCGENRWWSKVYLAHHTSCEACTSLVYPVLLCRRCGFAYFEGWRRRFPSGALGPDLYPEPDDADDEATYTRILFRPVHSGIPDDPLQAGEHHTLCLTCGRWMVPDGAVHFNEVAKHGCPMGSLIQVCSWESQLHGGVLEECVFCEQHWIPGEDVATPPAPSVYATATVLVEELERGIERNGVMPFESKLISFSDSRQQAAQLAYRFQKTNREFTFRQLVWQTLRDSPTGITTSGLIDELYDRTLDDHRLRRLLIDDETRLYDRSLLQRTITSLLFRESVTAYLTLEAQGIVRLSYDPRLLDEVSRVLQTDRLLFARITPQDQRAFMLFLLDWNMRFRYAIAPVPQAGLDVDWQWLERRNILSKSCVRSRADSIRGELNFVVSVATSRNRPFNLSKRLYDRVVTDRFRTEFTLSDLKQSLFAIWDGILVLAAGQAGQRSEASLYNIGRSDPDGAVLKISFDALRWSLIDESETIFRCNACGRISSYSVAGVCPLRDCTGTLEPITGARLDEEQFSPVRHYRRLIRQRSIRPLRVEEHTAQVAAAKRQAIEQDFRRKDNDGIDVICGSTTFELGIDLGTIHAVFMSNLPPRIANYRQRAGRAGRRAGMVPFILSYVRQRPHDQYFWNFLKEFIAGPVPTPHLSVSSQEVIERHANAVLVRDLMQDFIQRTHARAGLDGPAAEAFVNDVLATGQIQRLQRAMTDTSGRLRREYDLAFGSIPESDRPVAAAAHLGKRLFTLQRTYLALRANDGAIAVLSDYGILPSYAFPLYVDELRLNREPNDRPPRSELKLQRDRRIALQEYMPGKVIVAGKTLIESEGLWSGYEEKNFRICSNRDCQTMDFSENAPIVCPSCKQNRVTLTALIPWGGFFGSRVDRTAERDSELARQRGETYFDPANEPPPDYHRYGQALEVAIVGASVMEQSSYRPRMRQFNPRPYSDITLDLAVSSERDLALPNMPAVRCLRRVASANSTGLRYNLMHEFTTDIIRVRLLANATGQLLVSSPTFIETLRDNPENTRQRFYWDCFRRSLGDALVAAAARRLDIDSSELGISFHSAPDVVGGKELILFDTAPGGAGYVRQLATYIQEIFVEAERVLSSCTCGDSCYGCLRTYHNQMFHRRLNRRFVGEGIARFNATNWVAGWQSSSH